MCVKIRSCRAWRPLPFSWPAAASPAATAPCKSPPPPGLRTSSTGCEIRVPFSPTTRTPAPSAQTPATPLQSPQAGTADTTGTTARERRKTSGRNTRCGRRPGPGDVSVCRETGEYRVLTCPTRIGEIMRRRYTAAHACEPFTSEWRPPASAHYQRARLASREAARSPVIKQGQRAFRSAARTTVRPERDSFEWAVAGPSRMVAGSVAGWLSVVSAAKVAFG